MDWTEPVSGINVPDRKSCMRAAFHNSHLLVLSVSVLALTLGASLSVGAETDSALALAEQKFKSGNLEEALRECNKAQKSEKERARFFELRGSIEYELDLYKEAAEDLNRCLSLQPANCNALKIRSKAFTLLGNYPAAIRDADAAIKLNPGDATLYIERGHPLIHMRKCNEALTVLARSIAIKPSFRNLHQYGQCLNNMGRYGEGTTYLKKAISVIPQGDLCMADHRDRGNILLSQKKYEDALAEFTYCVSRNPSSFTNRLARSTCLKLMGRMNEAKADLVVAVEYDFGPNMTGAQHGGRGCLLLELRRFEEALREFKKVLVYSPKSAEVYSLMSECYKGMGLTREAINCLAHCTELAPSVVHYYTLRAVLLREIGQHNMILKDMEKALHYCPRPQHFHLHELHARSLFALGRTDEAMREIAETEKMVADRVQKGGIQALRAQFLMLLNRPKEAEKASIESVTTDPTNVDMQLFCANVLVVNKHYKEAAARLDALNIDKEQMRQLKERARLYTAIGLTDKASKDIDDTYLLQAKKAESAHEVRGLQLARAGDNAEALSEFLAALKETSNYENKLILIERCVQASRNQSFETFKLSRTLVQHTIADLVALRNGGDRNQFISLLLVELYLRLGEAKSAANELSIMIAANPDAQLFEKRGQIYFNDLFDFEKAENDMTQAISLSDTAGVAPLYQMRMTIRLAQGKIESGLSDLSIVITHGGQPYKQLALRAYLYMNQGKYGPALSDFNRAIALRDTTFARGRRGELHLILGNFEQAVEDLSIAIDGNYRPIAYYRLRATANERLGRYRQSLGDVKVILQRSPADRMALSMRARLVKRL